MQDQHQFASTMLSINKGIVFPAFGMNKVKNNALDKYQIDVKPLSVF